MNSHGVIHTHAVVELLEAIRRQEAETRRLRKALERIEALVGEMRPHLIAYRADVREEAENHPRPDVKRSAARIVRELNDFLERSRGV